MKEFDAIIIGFGKGGKTLATELAQHDWKIGRASCRERV